MSPRLVNVSYSELDAYRQCPLKWWLGYQQLWTKQPGYNRPLSKGSAWHTVMETHYKTIRAQRVSTKTGRFLEHPSSAKEAEILDACIRAVTPLLTVDPENDDHAEQLSLIAWLYQGHVEKYGIDLEWEVLAVERAGLVPLLTPRGNPSRFRLKYKIDLVIRNLEVGQIEVVDHKSAADFSRKTEIDIDDQFGLYSWAYHRETGRRVMGVIRSDARTRRNKGPMSLDDRFRRVPTYRTPGELDRIALDAYGTALEAYRAGRVTYSSPAPDRCSWRCDFLEPHLALRKGIGSTETVLSDFGFHRREAKHQEYTIDEGQR